MKITTPVDSRTSELEDLLTKGDSGADTKKPDTKVRQRSELEDSPTTGDSGTDTNKPDTEVRQRKNRKF